MQSPEEEMQLNEMNTLTFGYCLRSLSTPLRFWIVYTQFWIVTLFLLLQLKLISNWLYSFFEFQKNPHLLFYSYSASLVWSKLQRITFWPKNLRCPWPVCSWLQTPVSVSDSSFLKVLPLGGNSDGSYTWFLPGTQESHLHIWLVLMMAVFRK